jgi:hypothetical protein
MHFHRKWSGYPRTCDAHDQRKTAMQTQTKAPPANIANGD